MAKGGRQMEPKESDIILEALKCLRYDTERIEKLVVKTKSATTDDHTEVIDKLKVLMTLSINGATLMNDFEQLG